MFGLMLKSAFGVVIVDKMQLLSRLVRELHISPGQAIKLVASAPYRYKHYTIPKRQSGVRHIHHPSRELKTVQRWIVDNIISQLPVHECVYSYRAGRNITQHASLHSRSNYLLCFDFTDFFPSLTYPWVVEYLQDESKNGRVELDDEAIRTVARLVCRHDSASDTLALSIGAPSSPLLSNAMLYSLDDKVSQMASALGVQYTRYADDVYFSTTHPNILQDVENEFRRLVGLLTPGLRLNEMKTNRKSRKARRTVTGLVLTPTHEVSIGRSRKREIRTRVFLFSQGKLTKEDSVSLSGLLSFVSDAEPGFVLRLRRKFGDQIIDSLLTYSTD
ncbi:retron St85 family RNA-directed DNA polymerase [Arhodomonas aquaeolei]|uniref:retron St85 family RNA-directed DNA polymerase n=1 Tax=Arhodomonas aquaeolei TaxID=2369 RepID=UPI0035B5FC67